MKDPKAIRKAIMTAKSIASLIDPKFARVPLPDIGLPAPDFVVPDHSPSIHEAYGMPMPQKYAAGGEIEPEHYAAGGEVIKAWRNPSPKALRNLTERSTHGYMRGLHHGSDQFWWDADHAIHHDAAQMLGIPYNYKNRMDSRIDQVSGNYIVGADEGVPDHVVSHYERAAGDDDRYAAGGDVDAGRELNKFGLYSHAAEQAAALPQERGTPEQYRGMLLNRGVKPAELEWSGFDDAFANKPQVTRDELAEHFRTNMPDLFETQYGGSERGGESYNQMRDRHAQENRELFLNMGLAQAHGTPYEGETSTQMVNRHAEERANLKNQAYHEDYTIPGGENYREVLVQHNAFGGFEGVQNHFGGTPDIIASLRLKDREDHEGDKVLHLEELQSDWAQQGRKNGFADDAAAKHQAAREEYNNFIDRLSEMETQRRIDALKKDQPDFDFENNDQSLRAIIDDNVRRHPHTIARNLGLLDEFGQLRDAYNEAQDNDQYRKLPAKAAYVEKTNDWVDLGLKRALLEAAKSGSDKLAWTPGYKQADRYDLSRHISQIRHEKNDDGTYNLDVFDKNGTRVFDQDDMHPDALEETVGKEMAEKIMAGHGEKDEDPGYRDWLTLSGLDLRVGGEGMRKFYDEMLPKRLLKLAKQHDPDAKLTRSVITHKSDHDMYEFYPEDEFGNVSDTPANPSPERQTELPALEVTPKMRESILKKGFAAYADGGEVEGYAIGGVPDIDVEQYRKHLKRIYSPLSEDPESVKRALKIAGSYHAPVGMETGVGSLYTIKQSMPASAVTRTIQNIPGINLKPQKKGSWEDFYDLAKGNEFVNIGGDLSGFGRLTHINGKELAWPVDLHAGADYMREPNPGRVWANIGAHATGFQTKIREANERGKELYGILSPMGPSAVNSSHNMFDTLMAQIPNADIDPDHLKEFDEAIKRGDHLNPKIKRNPKLLASYLKKLEKWPGLEEAKEVSEFARPWRGNLTGAHRADIVKFMDKGYWRDRGFPEVGVTRAAITNPELLGAGGNKLGYRAVKLSAEPIKGDKSIFKHSTYPVDTFGEYVMDVPLVQRHYAQPDAIERMVMNPTKSGQIVHPYSEDAMGRSTARKLFEEQKQIQPVNQRFLDSVMMGMENQEKYGFKKGGTVRRALMIAKSAKKK